MTQNIVGTLIIVRGIVQGVGFRPFIYNLANKLGLAGWVRNSTRGVEIKLSGSQEQVKIFIDQVNKNSPPLSLIDSLEINSCLPENIKGFSILASEFREGEILPVSPDVGICHECQKELFDPQDRRYHYPFINCTHCGPRFTILREVPYDRGNTTMSSFQMCPDCLEEYENPDNRRFHAQPNACPICGPQVWMEAKGRCLAQNEAAIINARKWLKAGKILGVKGLGGFHLVCDATKSKTVEELRRRKQRSDKPFALMAFDVHHLLRHCKITPQDKQLLQSRQRPIVILSRNPNSDVAKAVAPNQNNLGVMLAYTPLHLLLLEPEPGFPDILVMTSGNLSEEPVAYQDEEGRERLAPLVDGFLLHNRPIYMRTDDSVVITILDQPYFIRRSRGYAPNPIHLAMDIPPSLGVGAELKNCFCLTHGFYAFNSHHIGDLENYETLHAYEQGIDHYERLFRVRPEQIACDLHPDYLSTRYARDRSLKDNLPLVEVQHHHAHLAACLAENQWTDEDPVIGVCFDGAGLGLDGAIWGGEVLLGGYGSFQRLYHLDYLPLPGGDQSTRKPARMALSTLWQAGLEWETDLAPVQSLCVEERMVLKSLIAHKINTPYTSSIGRLFDSAASILGVRQEIHYEGQAAIELESIADPQEKSYYQFEVEGEQFKAQSVIKSLVADWRNGLPIPQISARFHNSIVRLVLELCQEIRSKYGVSTVSLSGGVWQNKYLLERCVPLLNRESFTTLIHHHLPSNDANIALGQVMVAAHLRV